MLDLVQTYVLIMCMTESTFPFFMETLSSDESGRYQTEDS